TVAFCNEKIDIYLARNLTAGSQHLDEDEYVQVKAYTVDELTKMIYSGEIQDSKTVAAVLAYKDKLKMI
ncbi:MAG: NUDIX hydrolase, partial [Lachnospiraceae bacterium]|nr:NUDIX hydrolase [Lachnospiraceae bacterium]